jgi:hypothetical protein
MKFIWTRGKAAPPETRDSEEEDRAGAIRRYSPRWYAGYHPPRVFVDPTLCTLTQPLSDDERHAFASFRTACKGPQDLWDRSPFAHWMLEQLRQSWQWITLVPERELRTFSWRCVEALEGTADPALLELWRAVHGRLAGRTSLQQLQSAQDATRPLVGKNGTEGLTVYRAATPGQLALWHAASPFVYDGAFWVAEFTAIHEACVTLNERAAGWAWTGDGDPHRAAFKTAFFATEHPRVRAEALSDARKRQAALLRELLPAPFAGPAQRARVWQNQQFLYCLRCGPRFEHTVIDVFPDIRFKSCGWCDTSLVQRH